MTYEMKDFQKDEERLRKQAKDGKITEEEFFLELKKLHNRATEGEAKASEADEEWDETQVQCPNCYGDGVFNHNDEDGYWEEMCTICEGSGHIDRSFFQQGINEESWGITLDWRGKPEILWESRAEEEGTSDGAKKGWLTRKRGGSSEEEPRMAVSYTHLTLPTNREV